MYARTVARGFSNSYRTSTAGSGTHNLQFGARLLSTQVRALLERDHLGHLGDPPGQALAEALRELGRPDVGGDDREAVLAMSKVQHHEQLLHGPRGRVF